jgi:hypothetical protein
MACATSSSIGVLPYLRIYSNRSLVIFIAFVAVAVMSVCRLSCSIVFLAYARSSSTVLPTFLRQPFQFAILAGPWDLHRTIRHSRPQVLAAGRRLGVESQYWSEAELAL